MCGQANFNDLYINRPASGHKIEGRAGRFGRRQAFLNLGSSAAAKFPAGQDTNADQRGWPCSIGVHQRPSAA